MRLLWVCVALVWFCGELLARSCDAVPLRSTAPRHYPWEALSLEGFGEEVGAIPQIGPLDFIDCKKEPKPTGCRQERLRFYSDLYMSYLWPQALGRRDQKGVVRGKVGVMYECYFGDLWRFYTDDRLVFEDVDGAKDLFLEVNELYLQNFHANNTVAVVGRKKIKDRRSWWYNAPLDLAGFELKRGLMRVRGYFGGRLDRRVVEDESDAWSSLNGVRFGLVHGVYEYRYNRFWEMIALYERSEPEYPLPDVRRAFWVGGRYVGVYERKSGVQKAWLDLGVVRGRGGGEAFGGVGVDVGLRHEPLGSPWAFVGQVAYGSGGESGHYTQPRIAYRRSRFYDENLSIRYYGELLDPDLNNIFIAAVRGFYHADRGTYMFGLYRYWQQQPRVAYFESNGFYPASGKSKDIGTEIDFLYRYESERYHFKAGVSYFAGGGAFGYLDEPDAYKITFSVRYFWR